MEVRIAWPAAVVAVCCLATELSLLAGVKAADNNQELNNCKPPSIVSKSVPKAYLIINTKINLPCIAQGDGKLTYTWTKNGKPLDLSSEASRKRMTTKSGTGSLVIYKARGTDEGFYQCSVVNNCGTSLSVTTALYHAKMAPFPRVSKPTTIKRVLGSSAILQCTPPASVPKASIAWILTDSTDQPLTYDEDNQEEIGFNTVPLDRRVTTDYHGNLYITSVLAEDEHNGQTYVCVSQNAITRSSNRGEDKVLDIRGNEVTDMGVDLMWNSDTNNMALQGKRAKFKCIFSGHPEPEIKWTRVTGGEMDPTRMETDYHELRIKDLQFEDAGQYRCSGQNALSPDPRSHTFTLEVKSSPKWRVQPRDVTAGVEESASFECDAVGNPKPTVQWFVNGKRYNKDSSKGVLNGNTLVFKKLDKEDSQVIQCNASNIYGYIWSDVYLYVEALPPEIKTKPHDNLIVAIEKDVTLTCQVTGKPKPKVVWYKGNQFLSHDRFEIQDSGNLVIENTTLKDTGPYKCKATNRFGEASADGSLVVRDKTHILTPPVNAEVEYAKQVTFTCSATTDHAEMKNLRFQWLKDGTPLQEDPRVEVDGGVITITDTQSKDTGAYTCVAENGVDNDTATATLQVKAPPEPPRDVTVIECLSKKVMLSWKFDDKMKNFDEMVRFIVEYQTDYDPDAWIKVKNVHYAKKNITFELSPYANYRFRMRAVNKMGVSMPSEETQTSCQALMASPDKNPEDVRTDEQYTGFLVIKWTPMDKLDMNGPQFKYIIEVQSPNGNHSKYTVDDYKIDEYRIKVDNVYKPYLISIKARNQVGFAMAPVNKVIGYSGETAPKVIPQNFDLDREVNVTATMAGFMWDPVDTSPEAIQGKFRGYKIRFWIKGQKDKTMHEEIIPSREGDRLKRDVDNKERGRIMNLPSFSEIYADVVVINTNFESEGSNIVNLTTPEGVPGPVKFLEAIYRGSNHINVFWRSPVHPNGIITGYHLSYNKVDGLDIGDRVVVNENIAPEDERETIQDLEPDTRYTIYIKARTKEGYGEELFIDVMTASQLLDLMLPVIDDVIVLDNEANISWTLDMSDKGGRMGQIYYLQHKKKGEEDWHTSSTPIQNKFWAQLDHLDPGTVYKVRVIAMAGEDGKKKPSEIKMFRTSGVGAARASFLTAAWFIGMMIAIAILILILIIVCIIKRNRGDNYPVQEKERLRGNCDDNHDQFNEFGKGDENGIGGSSSFDNDGEKVPLDVDADSMDYGDDDASRFNEDGSFIGQYGRGDKANDVANVSASSIV